MFNLATNLTSIDNYMVFWNATILAFSFIFLHSFNDPQKWSLQVCCKFLKKSRSLELNTELKYCSVLKLMRSSELFSYLLRATTSIANVSSTPKFEGAKKKKKGRKRIGKEKKRNNVEISWQECWVDDNEYANRYSCHDRSRGGRRRDLM